MIKPATLDPLAHWRDLVTQVEKGVNQFAGKAMASDGFSSSVNRLTWGPLVAKKLAADLAAGVAQRLNVPTRADIVALGERLQTIEDRLIEVTYMLGRMNGDAAAGTVGAAPRPRRTRKPPAAKVAVPEAKTVAAPKRKPRARKAPR